MTARQTTAHASQALQPTLVKMVANTAPAAKTLEINFLDIKDLNDTVWNLKVEITNLVAHGRNASGTDIGLLKNRIRNLRTRQRATRAMARELTKEYLARLDVYKPDATRA